MYKFIDEYDIVPAPSVIKYEDEVYVNPSDELLRSLGYKPLIIPDPPEHDETEYIVVKYKENENDITQIYEIHKYDEEFI